MQKKYKNYFKNHYKVSYSDADINNSKKWLTSQWNEINKIVGISQEKNILEIGSAFGGFYNLLDINNKSKKYTGLELDEQACKFANKYFNTDSFKNISLEKFSSKQKYDYIFAFEVLEHLDNPDESIKNIYNLLAPGGYFIGTSPFPFEKNVLADETHKYVLHPKSWKNLFDTNNFKSVKISPMSFFPYIWRIFPNLNFLLPFYISLKYFISTSLIIAKK